MTLLIAILVVWRLTSLLVHEYGPFEVFERIRRLCRVIDREAATGEQLNRWLEKHPNRPVPESFSFNLAGEILSCFWCCSIWVAMPVAAVLGESRIGILFYIFALSAGAIILEVLLDALQRIDGSAA